MGVSFWLGGQLLEVGTVIDDTPPPTPVARMRVSRLRVTAAAGTVTPPSNPRDAFVTTVGYGNYNPSLDQGNGLGRLLGPLPGSTLTPFNGTFVVQNDGQVIRNLEIFGWVDLNGKANVVIENCIIYGPPDTAEFWGKLRAPVFTSAEDYKGLRMTDCLLVGRGNYWFSACRGANWTIRRCEFRNWGDGIAMVGAKGNRTLEGCWVHDGLHGEWTDAEYANGSRPYAGGYYTHNDAVQWGIGGNDVVRGNMLGGWKAGQYQHHTGHAADINRGDDCSNSAMIIKQEVSNSTANKLQNIIIEKNWFQGGAATLNITTIKADAAGPKNLLESVYIRNNRFVKSYITSQVGVQPPRGVGTVVPQLYLYPETGLKYVLTGNLLLDYVDDPDSAGVPLPAPTQYQPAVV